MALVTFEMDGSDRATILAALAYWAADGMGDPDNRTDGMHDIATAQGAEISLDDKGIGELRKTLAGLNTRTAAPLYVLRWHSKHSEDWPETSLHATKAGALARAKAHMQDSGEEEDEVQRALRDLERTGNASELVAEGYMAITQMHVNA